MKSTTKVDLEVIKTSNYDIIPDIKKLIVFRLKRRKKALRIKPRKSTRLWSDKHKPQKVEELLGNGYHIRKLKKWLQNWNTNLKKTSNTKRSKGSPHRKATLILGPPGIGKSLSIALVARSMGYKVVELNAADIISKKELESSLFKLTQNAILNFKPKNKTKRLIVIDEVDGMGYSGAMQTMVVAIKKSKTPIICICNDVQKSSVRSLSKHCLVLKFIRPPCKTIVDHLIMVAKKEEMNVERKALDVLVHSAGGDIRQILNSMQMWNSGDKGMTYVNIQARKSEICKDEIQRISVFDAAGYLLACPKNTSFCKKRDELFFVEPNIMPLFIHMNYLSSIRGHNHKKNKIPDVMSEAADLIAEADIYDSYIYIKGRSELLTKQAVTIAAVGFKTRGRVGWCKFPETLGKMSTIKKRKHLLSEFVAHTGLHTSKTSMRLDYLISLRNHCMRPLSNLHNTEGVKQSVNLLQNYGFTHETFEGLSKFGLGSEKRDLFSGSSLKSKIKAAFNS